MDIFISYRRGQADAANAGRIHDYLAGKGYPSFYDRDEKANPFGAQFPETLARALSDCKVLIAVMGETWFKEAHRLKEEKDWVRYELLHAKAVRFIPIVFSADPDAIKFDLPDELAFLATANHIKWESFEDQQKGELKEILEGVLPRSNTCQSAADFDHLELLCDRGPAADGFVDALTRRLDPKRPGCWVLFGEEGEGQGRILERIEAHTLKKYAAQYSHSRFFDLELGDYRRPEDDEIQAQIIRKVAAPSVNVESYEELYDLLTKRKLDPKAEERMDLGVLYSVVSVNTTDDAEWWIALFARLRDQFPVIESTGPQIVLALSMSYVEPKRSGLLTFFGEHRPIERYFRRQYPHLFADDQDVVRRESARRTDMSVRRLHSATKEHVRRWCENEDVRDKIASHTPFLAQFKKAAQRPMDDVLDTLRDVLLERRA